MDFKGNIKTNIDTTNDNEKILNNNTTSNNTANGVFILKKKEDDKTGKKVFNVYMEEERLKKLDKLCKISRYSRNELVNMMIDFCISNYKIED